MTTHNPPKEPKYPYQISATCTGLGSYTLHFEPIPTPNILMKHITSPYLRIPALVAIALAIAALTHFAYTTGLYVGEVRTRTEAMEAGAGHYDIFHGDEAPAGWLWTPDPNWAPKD